MRIKCFFLLALLIGSFFLATPALAQDGDGPWGEVVDADGNLRYDLLTDLGERHESVSWMPNLPFLEGQATYHEYLTPSGDRVVLPSASTLFFMAMNPEASGLNQADSALGSGVGVLETMLAGYLSPADLANHGYADPAEFFQDVIDGQSNLWTFGGLTTLNFLTDLLSSSLADGNLYTMILLYTGEGEAPLVVDADRPPVEVACPSPYVTTGPIALSGDKIAPPKPVVVGQDPEGRGVDVRAGVQVPPVIYHYFVKVLHHEEGCSRAQNGSGGGCPDHPGDPHYKTTVDTWFECEEHTRAYTDRVASVQVSIRLTRDSRQWILNDLSHAYPGAHLLHPDFSFSYSGGGASWSQVIPHIQTADPGHYTVHVYARTTGTPVSAPRSASASLGQFLVELVRVTLIEAP